MEVQGDMWRTWWRLLDVCVARPPETWREELRPLQVPRCPAPQLPGLPAAVGTPKTACKMKKQLEFGGIKYNKAKFLMTYIYQI